jgi:tetratricopeptide (TPR) repeat protein
LGQTKQALQNYEAGISALNKNDAQKAIQFFTLAASKDSLYLDPTIALFQVYHDQKDFQKASQYYFQIKKIDSAAAVPFLVKQGIALASLGRYDAAYQLLVPYISNNSLPAYLKEKATALYAVCQFAIAEKMAPEISIQNMGDSINSPASEYFPTVSIQDSLFLFMRRLNLSREDFYTSSMGADGFSAALPLSDTLNFAAKKGSMSLSADLQTLYYAADYAEQGYGRYDIYKVQRSPWGWSKPKNLGQNINSDFWDSAPSIAPDGNAIYFASNRPDGYGGIDIYVSFKNEKGYWEEAINLGPSINTKGDDQTPFIHADNQSLYFSSNGRAGFGGSDIYVSRKKIDGNWTTPINLGYPINTYDNEGSIAVASNGATAYIASDRSDSLKHGISKGEL